MTKKRILLVYKKSLYEIYGQHLDSPEIKRYMQDSGETSEEILKNHELHTKTLDIVTRFLSENASVEAIYRADLPNGINNFDLVVCVGGDGTFLEAAGYITSNVPIVGINSTEYFKMETPVEGGEPVPVHKGSTGFFCGISRTENLERRLQELLGDKIPVKHLTRLEAEIDGKPLDRLILNELLVAHENPAAGMICKVIVGKSKEGNEENRTNDYIEDEQGNSGILIATPQESWAIKAGGGVLELGSRTYQIVAREKYKGRYDSIIVDDKESEIVSRTRKGKIYCDGSHNMYDFTLGAHLKVRVSDKPLYVVGFNEQKREEHITKNQQQKELVYS